MQLIALLTYVFIVIWQHTCPRSVLCWLCQNQHRRCMAWTSINLLFLWDSKNSGNSKRVERLVISVFLSSDDSPGDCASPIMARAWWHPKGYSVYGFVLFSLTTDSSTSIDHSVVDAWVNLQTFTDFVFVNHNYSWSLKDLTPNRLGSSQLSKVIGEAYWT